MCSLEEIKESVEYRPVLVGCIHGFGPLSQHFAGTLKTEEIICNQNEKYMECNKSKYEMVNKSRCLWHSMLEFGDFNNRKGYKI